MYHHSESRDAPDPVEPRIYVASLSDYNNGYLHGRWIRATQTSEHIYDEIQQMLATSPSPSAEEWAIHDHEGFATLALAETVSIEALSRLAKRFTQLGHATKNDS